MNVERPEELEAKLIVERVLGIELEHSDKNGGVDYLSLDRRIAVEVTRVTDGRRAATRKAMQKSKAAGTPSGPLQHCWLLFASDTQRAMKSLIQNVHPLIVQLEAAGETSFYDQVAAIHVVEQGPLSHVYRPLLLAGVQRASAAPHRDDPPHAHRLIVTLGSGGSSSGSDEAVTLLSETLGRAIDNPKKLSESGAAERHLFVWLDDDTAFNIARPLSRDAPSFADEGFGLPSSAPALDRAVTHLWVMHERSRLGWLWDGETWSELRHL